MVEGDESAEEGLSKGRIMSGFVRVGDGGAGMPIDRWVAGRTCILASYYWGLGSRIEEITADTSNCRGSNS